MKYKKQNNNVKQCKECGRLFENTSDNFGAAKFKGICYLRNYCIKCQNKRALRERRKLGKEYRERHNEQCRIRHLRIRYGLTPKQADELYSRGCEICGSTEKLCIDHNHETGEVRGCLCNNCNTAIGMFSEDVSLLEAAKQYVLKYKG